LKDRAVAHQVSEAIVEALELIDMDEITGKLPTECACRGR
jgi:hypothetical protein